MWQLLLAAANEGEDKRKKKKAQEDAEYQQMMGLDQGSPKSGDNGTGMLTSFLGSKLGGGGGAPIDNTASGQNLTSGQASPNPALLESQKNAYYTAGLAAADDRDYGIHSDMGLSTKPEPTGFAKFARNNLNPVGQATYNPTTGQFEDRTFLLFKILQALSLQGTPGAQTAALNERLMSGREAQQGAMKQSLLHEQGANTRLNQSLAQAKELATIEESGRNTRATADLANRERLANEAERLAIEKMFFGEESADARADRMFRQHKELQKDNPTRIGENSLLMPDGSILVFTPGNPGNTAFGIPPSEPSVKRIPSPEQLKAAIGGRTITAPPLTLDNKPPTPPVSATPSTPRERALLYDTPPSQETSDFIRDLMNKLIGKEGEMKNLGFNKKGGNWEYNRTGKYPQFNLYSPTAMVEREKGARTQQEEQAKGSAKLKEIQEILEKLSKVYE